MGRAGVADKSNGTDPTRCSGSVERWTATLSLLVRVPFFGLESSLFGGASGPSRFAFTRNYQGAPDKLHEPLFSQITVAALASHVTRDHTDASLSSESGRKLVEEPYPLIIVERARRGNIPENLDTRRSLVDVLPSGARRSGYSDIKLMAWNRE